MQRTALSMYTQAILRSHRRYGLVSFRLSRAKVPPALWDLIPEAELLGVPNDAIRNELARSLSPVYVLDLVRRVRAQESRLKTWLAIERSLSAYEISREYVAFECLKLAAEYAYLLMQIFPSRRLQPTAEQRPEKPQNFHFEQGSSRPHPRGLYA